MYPNKGFPNQIVGSFTRFKWQTGFTLLEVIIAVAIVGVLSAIGSNHFFDHIRKTRVSTAQQFLQELAGVMERSYLNTKTFTADVPLSYTRLPEAIQDDYDPPIIATFDTSPPSYRIFLNARLNSPILSHFDTSLPPGTLNLALDNNGDRWFETTTCTCAVITWASCVFETNENPWEDQMGATTAAATAEWAVAAITYRDPANGTAIADTSTASPDECTAF